MVLLVLWVKAELENVKSIEFPPNMQYCLDVKDSQGADTKEGIFVCVDEESDMAGSRGVANFVMRFPECSKQVSITMQEVKKLTKPIITAEDSGSW